MRAFLIFLLALALSSSASAQDLLVKRNGEKIKVKVLKITKKKVEFVRHGTELPVYSLPISDIDYIEYPMGDRDTFGRAVTPTPAPKEPEKWHGPVPTPDGKTSVEYTPQNNDEQKPAIISASESSTAQRGEVGSVNPNSSPLYTTFAQVSLYGIRFTWHISFIPPL